MIRWIALVAGILIMAFVFGYSTSDRSGMQPGYFEKAEAPAYGVGGGESFAKELGSDYEKHLKELYKEIQ